MKRYNPGEISPGFIASEGKKVQTDFISVENMLTFISRSASTA